MYEQALCAQALEAAHSNYVHLHLEGAPDWCGSIHNGFSHSGRSWDEKCYRNACIGKSGNELFDISVG